MGGHGDGFAMVLSQSRGTSVRRLGQGYKNFPGNLLPWLLIPMRVSYGVTDGRKIALFMNSNMDATCSTPWTSGYKWANFIHVRFWREGSDQDFSKTPPSYDSIRKKVYVYIDGTVYGSWVQILQAHMDLKECSVV